MPEQKWIEKDLTTAYDWEYNGATTSITTECVLDDRKLIFQKKIQVKVVN